MLPLDSASPRVCVHVRAERFSIRFVVSLSYGSHYRKKKNRLKTDPNPNWCEWSNLFLFHSSHTMKAYAKHKSL